VVAGLCPAGTGQRRVTTPKSNAAKLKAMSTQIATYPATTTAPSSAGILLPAFTLWWREIVRFYRQRARVVGVIVSPLLFWVVLGSGFGTSFRSGQAAGQQHYLDYFYPGTLVMIVLFTAIFTMMSVIEDRNEGFLLSVLVAPVPRAAIVLGKVLGGTTLAALQGLIFLVFSPLVGIHMTLASFGLIVLTVFLVSFALTALGFAIAWPMDSTTAFHAIINLFLIPLWLLSGALFPLSKASGWIRWIMYANPLTYGVEALRALMYPGAPSSFSFEFSLTNSLLTLVLFALFMFGLAFLLANRRTTKPAA
jgi:ABC-2 type transport system permease protein